MQEWEIVARALDAHRVHGYRCSCGAELNNDDRHQGEAVLNALDAHRLGVEHVPVSLPWDELDELHADGHSLEVLAQERAALRADLALVSAALETLPDAEARAQATDALRRLTEELMMDQSVEEAVSAGLVEEREVTADAIQQGAVATTDPLRGLVAVAPIDAGQQLRVGQWGPVGAASGG
jgi:hypothetical protein